MGYEYELIKDFARSEGLKLNIKVAESPAKLIEMLEREKPMSSPTRFRSATA